MAGLDGMLQSLLQNPETLGALTRAIAGMKTPPGPMDAPPGHDPEHEKTDGGKPPSAPADAVVARPSIAGAGRVEATGENTPSASPFGQLLSSPMMRNLCHGARERQALLCALRPYFEDARRQKIDTMLGVLSALDALSVAENLL